MPAAHQVALSPEALDDIARLDDFLRSKNPPAANRMLDTFEHALNRLADTPRRGRRVPWNTVREIREMVVRFGQGSYVLRYEVTPDLVLVARIWHGRENR